jgi:hypothetical protein
MKKFMWIFVLLFFIGCFGGGGGGSSASFSAPSSGETITEGTPEEITEEDITVIDGEVPTPPEVIIPGEPEIVEVYTEYITPFPEDTNFFYLESATKVLHYFKNNTLTQATLTYTATEKTYTDGVLTSTVNIPLSTYQLTEFFSIVSGGIKTLYFTVHERHYKQVAGVVSEIDVLPTKPIKSKISYTSTATTIYIDANNLSRVRRKTGDGTYNNAIITNITNGCYVGQYSTVANGVLSGVIFNVYRIAGESTTLPVGLYFFSTMITFQNPWVVSNKNGIMW